MSGILLDGKTLSPKILSRPRRHSGERAGQSNVWTLAIHVQRVIWQCDAETRHC